MVWNFFRKTDSAEEDRVMTADLVFPVFRQHVAMLGVIIVAGKIEMIVIQIDVEPAGHRLKNTKSFRTTSLPMPSPAMTAILNLFFAICGLSVGGSKLVEGHRMRPVDIVDLFHDIVIDPDLKAAKRVAQLIKGRRTENHRCHERTLHGPGKRHLG